LSIIFEFKNLEDEEIENYYKNFYRIFSIYPYNPNKFEKYCLKEMKTNLIKETS